MDATMGQSVSTTLSPIKIAAHVFCENLLENLKISDFYELKFKINPRFF